MTKPALPILYSFRRCPYAMRARLAIAVSGVVVEAREVLLSNKPKDMLECSPKGTVPVILLPDDMVLDESYDIMLWALEQNDPEQWLPRNSLDEKEIQRLIEFNDDEFKPYLDKYKYASRYPEQHMVSFRESGEVFLKMLEQKLGDNQFLIGGSISLADMAIMPFIRQFAYVDIEWFESSNYINIQKWLETLLNTSLFKQVMEKRPVWQA